MLASPSLALSDPQQRLYPNHSARTILPELFRLNDAKHSTAQSFIYRHLPWEVSVANQIRGGWQCTNLTIALASPTDAPRAPALTV